MAFTWYGRTKWKYIERHLGVIGTDTCTLGRPGQCTLSAGKSGRTELFKEKLPRGCIPPSFEVAGTVDTNENCGHTNLRIRCNNMGRFKVAGVASFLAIGGFLFGYDSGIIASSIAQPHFIEYMGDPTPAERGGIVSSFTGGAILGALSVSFLADRFGRKKTVFVGSLVSILGSALQGGAVNMPMMIAGRLIAGFSVGLLSAVVPMYCSEIAIAADRGKLSGLLQFMLSWGFFIAQWLGYGSFQVDSHFQWRFPLSFQVVPGLIMCAGIWFMDESPRWLAERERFEDTKLVLTRLHGTGSNDDFVELEFREIVDTIMAEKQLAVWSWKDMVSRPSWRRRLMLGMGVQAFGQLSGINVMYVFALPCLSTRLNAYIDRNYYGPQIYKILGIDTGTSLQIIGISGSLSIVYCAIGLWLLDKIGRIKPLIVSAAGMASALLVNSVMSRYYVLPEHVSPNGNALRAMVAMNFVFSLFYTMIGIISWVYPAEVGAASAALPLFLFRPLLSPMLIVHPPDLPRRNSRSRQFALDGHQLEPQPGLRPMRANCAGECRLRLFLLLLCVESDCSRLLCLLLSGNKAPDSGADEHAFR